MARDRLFLAGRTKRFAQGAVRPSSTSEIIRSEAREMHNEGTPRKEANMTRKGDGLYLRGKVWYLDAHTNGHRHVVRLGKGIIRTVAGELANVKRAAIPKGEAGIGKKRKDCTFDKAKESFIDWMLANKRPRTQRVYRKALERLSQSFTNKTLRLIQAFDIERHKRLRVEAGARVQANREIALLKNLFNRTKAWGLYEGENPALGVKMLEDPKRRLRYLEYDEEVKLLEVSHSLAGRHCNWNE
jgi:hypothetical protein